MKRVVVALVMAVLLTGCENPCYHVSVYGKDGTLIKEYLEVTYYSQSDGSTILLLSNGSKVVINSDMVVIEEE